MSDPRSRKDSAAKLKAGSQSSKPKPTNPVDQNFNNERRATTTASTSAGTARPTARATHVSAEQRAQDADHGHRSQTMAIPPKESHRRAPASNATTPLPSARQLRTPSGQNPLPGSRTLDRDQADKDTVKTNDYRVEHPLPKSRPAQERGDLNQWLTPQGPAMLDARQSGSSFQTEPSSYYSADDNLSTSAPPPPMPVPSTGRQEEPENLYESLWLAAQPPSVSTDDDSAPSIPNPYGSEEGGEPSSMYIAQNDHWTPNAPLGMPHNGQSRPYPPSFPSHDHSDSVPPQTPPGMPSSSAASPPMPQPNVEDSLDAKSLPRFPQPEPAIPSTAPLRVHHRDRPTSALPTSATFSGRQSSRPTAQNFDVSHPAGPDAGIPGEQPPRSSSDLKMPGSMPIATPSNSAQNHTSIYAQQSAQPQSYTASSGAKPQFNAFYSTASSANRPEAGAPATASTLSALPLKASFTPNQPNSQRPTAHQVTSPPPGPAVASAISSSATQKPSIYQTQSNARPQATSPPIPQTVAANELSSNAASKPGALQPQSNARPQGAPTSRPQNSFSGSSKPNTTYSPQTNVGSQVIERPRPQNNANGSIKPNTTQSQKPYESHRPQPAAAAAPKPQQQPSSSAAAEKEKEKEEAKATSAAITASTPTRPRLHGEPSQMDTQYVNMMLALDDIPALHNILAGFFNWILLAGFILFPGTFASLQNVSVPGTQITEKLIHEVTNLPLFIVAWVCCGAGAAGLLWFWWRWRKNYLWAVNKIFTPGLMNSLAGFISTVANIYGVQHGQYSTTSKITIIVTGASTGIFLVLFLFYTFWLVKRVKARHDREVGKQRAGKYGEGVVDLSKRKI